MPGTKEQRGQYFTANPRVQGVLGSLIRGQCGVLLEPSAGAGHLVAWVEQHRPGLRIEAVDVDPAASRVCRAPVAKRDFFVFAGGRDGMYAAVLGNPPYVAWKAVEASTRVSAAGVKERYSGKANLYYLFIDRCIDLLAPGGELVFIVPKEWLYASSAAPLRRKAAAAGAITDVVDCGEEKLFADADVPALVIFRFCKGATSSQVRFAGSLADAEAGQWQKRELRESNGRYLLLAPGVASSIRGWVPLGSAYRVRVGVVTGADAAFRVGPGATVEPSCVQEYVTTKGVEQFIDVNHVDEWASMPAGAAAHLTRWKGTLLARRIAQFDESNWWKYGAVRNARHMRGPAERFYAYAKTRSATPFFACNAARMHGGGILGLYRVAGAAVAPATAIRVLNHPAYRPVLEAMFLTTGNKVSLQPATLEDAPFPPSEAAARAWLRSAG